MVHFLYRSQPSFFQAQFAKRVLFDIVVTDSFPRASVFPVDIRVAFISVIAAPCLRLVRGTVLFFRQIWTSGVRTGAFRAFRHQVTSKQTKRKASTRMTSRRLCIYLSIIYLSTENVWKTMETTVISSSVSQLFYT